MNISKYFRALFRKNKKTSDKSTNTVNDFKKINHITQNNITVNSKKSSLINSTIKFSGTNNSLIVEDGVTIKDSNINFNASNSTIYLSRNIHPYYVSIFINNNSVLYIGKNNYFNKKISIIMSEEKNIVIGDNCLFSFDIFIRNADPHLIYDISSEQRINPSRSIVIGDHVWIGQGCLLLKNTFIGSGSIIGGHSVISGKKIPSNQIWAGNPVRKIRDQIFWSGECVHAWTKEQSEKFHKKNASHIYNDQEIDCVFDPDNFDIFELAKNENYYRFSLREHK